MSKLQQLATLLRDQSRWPDDFIWNYAEFATCALGLAKAAGITRVRRGIPERDMAAIFITPASSCRATRHLAWVSVTPAIVADRIDAYLARPKL